MMMKRLPMNCEDYYTPTNRAVEPRLFSLVQGLLLQVEVQELGKRVSLLRVTFMGMSI